MVVTQLNGKCLSEKCMLKSIQGSNRGMQRQQFRNGWCKYTQVLSPSERSSICLSFQSSLHPILLSFHSLILFLPSFLPSLYTNYLFLLRSTTFSPFWRIQLLYIIWLSCCRQLTKLFHYALIFFFIINQLNFPLLLKCVDYLLVIFCSLDIFGAMLLKFYFVGFQSILYVCVGPRLLFSC